MAINLGQLHLTCTPIFGSFSRRPNFSSAHESRSTPIRSLKFKSCSTPVRSLKFKSCDTPREGNNVFSLGGGSSLYLSGNAHSLWKDSGGSTHLMPTTHAFSRPLRLPPRVSMVPGASKRSAVTEMPKKPRWWWRSLACVPYLLPIADNLVCAESAFHIQNFLKDLGFLTYPLLDTMVIMPSWFMMAFSFLVYLWVVRRKELPHFFRFHVIMSMLLGCATQIVIITSNWFPRFCFSGGEILQRFWITLALLQLFTVLECIRCAITGVYADVPFICDAAYAHSYVH